MGEVVVPAGAGVILPPARVQSDLASRRAGPQHPLDPVCPDLTDIVGLAAETVLPTRLGFQGKTCYRQNQADAVNDSFTPAPAEVERVRRVVAAFDDALARGSASPRLEGQFVDYPVAAKACLMVESAGWFAVAHDAP